VGLVTVQYPELDLAQDPALAEILRMGADLANEVLYFPRSTILARTTSGRWAYWTYARGFFAPAAPRELDSLVRRFGACRQPCAGNTDQFPDGIGREEEVLCLPIPSGPGAAARALILLRRDPGDPFLMVDNAGRGVGRDAAVAKILVRRLASALANDLERVRLRRLQIALHRRYAPRERGEEPSLGGVLGSFCRRALEALAVPTGPGESDDPVEVFRCSIRLFDAQRGLFRTAGSFASDTYAPWPIERIGFDLSRERTKGRGPIWRCLDEPYTPHRIPKVRASDRFAFQDTRSIIAAPVLALLENAPSGVSGVIAVHRTRGEYSRADAEILFLFASQISEAIVAALLRDRLERLRRLQDRAGALRGQVALLVPGGDWSRTESGRPETHPGSTFLGNLDAVLNGMGYDNVEVWITAPAEARLLRIYPRSAGRTSESTSPVASAGGEAIGCPGSADAPPDSPLPFVACTDPTDAVAQAWKLQQPRGKFLSQDGNWSDPSGDTTLTLPLSHSWVTGDQGVVLPGSHSEAEESRLREAQPPAPPIGVLRLRRKDRAPTTWDEIATWIQPLANVAAMALLRLRQLTIRSQAIHRAPGPVCIVDVSGRILHSSGAFWHLLDTPEPQTSGASLGFYEQVYGVIPEDCPASSTKEALRADARPGEPRSRILHLHDPERERTVEQGTNEIKDEFGVLHGYVISLDDVTLREALSVGSEKLQMATRTTEVLDAVEKVIRRLGYETFRRWEAEERGVRLVLRG